MIKKLIIKIRQNWLLILILTIFTVLLTATVYYFYRTERKKTINDFGNQLNTLADLKSKQITLWLNERLVDGQTLQNDEAFSQDIAILINEPKNFDALLKYQDRLRTLLLDPNYSSIFLVNRNGTIILRVGKLDENPGDDLLEIITESESTGEIEISDLFLTSDNTVRMDMVVPIYPTGNKEQPASIFIVYLITPDRILFPLIQSLPTNYQTAETLLIRREEDSVLYLNELRFKADTALKLRISLADTEIPAVMAAKGVVGIVNGEDYRGVPVLASISPVQNTNWMLVAKLDWDEINKPIIQQSLILILSSLFLLISLGLALSLIWRKQSEKIITGLSDSENERKKLEEKYLTLFSQSNDAILLVEESGKIFEANDQALKLYGYTRDEFLSLSNADLRDASSVNFLNLDMKRVKNGDTSIFETTHRKKNGEVINVDISSRYLTVGGHSFFQTIVRNITEKKTAERELRKSENLLKKIYDLLPVGLMIIDHHGKIIRTNKKITEIWGKYILTETDEPIVFHGCRLPSREVIKPGDWASDHTIKEGVTINDEMIEINAFDGKVKTLLNYSTPILNEKGELEGAIVLNLEITELKNAEEQLSAQLDELRRWNLATLGRENRVRDLKNEINGLLVKQGLPPKYPSVAGDDHE